MLCRLEDRNLASDALPTRCRARGRQRHQRAPDSPSGPIPADRGGPSSWFASTLQRSLQNWRRPGTASCSGASLTLPARGSSRLFHRSPEAPKNGGVAAPSALRQRFREHPRPPWRVPIAPLHLLIRQSAMSPSVPRAISSSQQIRVAAGQPCRPRFRRGQPLQVLVV